MVKYAIRRLELTELHIGQWVSYRGQQYQVCAVSRLFDDPYVHLVPSDDDWDHLLELHGRDIQFLFPSKLHRR